MSTKMSSNDLYKILQEVFAEAEEDLGERVYISVYAGAFDSKGPSFKISEASYSTKEVTVDGRDFWQCVEEFKRRKAFAEQQKLLAIGAPVIES